MNQYKKNSGSGLNTFLEASGVLATGTKEEIQRQKRMYWNNYKREYNKQKRKEHKVFEIFFDKKEFEIVRRSAQKRQTSVTNYIKLKALADHGGLVPPSVIGELREVLYLNYTAIENATEENQLSEKLGTQILQRLISIEKIVFNALGKRRPK